MKNTADNQPGPQRQGSFWLCLLVFLGIGVFFLFSEHRAHTLGALPFLLLLLCPVLHLFMHRGHGHGPGKDADKVGADQEKGERP